MFKNSRRRAVETAGDAHQFRACLYQNWSGFYRLVLTWCRPLYLDELTRLQDPSCPLPQRYRLPLQLSWNWVPPPRKCLQNSPLTPGGGGFPGAGL